MNYIQIINAFWKHRRGKRITSLQADLYFFLVQECNEKDWENPFECSNGLICASIGTTEKSLGEARNRLKQLGLIDFEAGITKKKSPVYYIRDYWNKVSNNVSSSGGKPVGNSGGNTVGNSVNIYNKQNETETKPNTIDESFEKFWDMYDKKKGDKDKLKKKWATLLPVDQELILEYIPRYKKYQPDKQYRKDPATFLNNKAWLDEIIGEKPMPEKKGYAHAIPLNENKW